MPDPGFELALLAQLVANLLKVGHVVEVAGSREHARVTFGGTQSTAFLKVFQDSAGAVKDHVPIAVGEQVLVLSPGGDTTCGLILRGLHGGGNPAPSTSDSEWRRTFPDGARISYDWAAHRLHVNALDADGTLVLEAKNIVLRTGPEGYFQTDHAGYVTRLTHKGGNAFETESWTTGAVVTGKPDHGFHPPRVVSPAEDE